MKGEIPSEFQSFFPHEIIAPVPQGWPPGSTTSLTAATSIYRHSNGTSSFFQT